MARCRSTLCAPHSAVDHPLLKCSSPLSLLLLNPHWSSLLVPLMLSLCSGACERRSGGPATIDNRLPHIQLHLRSQKPRPLPASARTSRLSCPAQSLNYLFSTRPRAKALRAKRERESCFPPTIESTFHFSLPLLQSSSPEHTAAGMRLDPFRFQHDNANSVDSDQPETATAAAAFAWHRIHLRHSFNDSPGLLSILFVAASHQSHPSRNDAKSQHD